MTDPKPDSAAETLALELSEAVDATGNHVDAFLPKIREYDREREEWMYQRINEAEANAALKLREREQEVARLREQNHESATRFQKEISALKLKLIPDQVEQQERDRVLAFLFEHPNERGKDQRTKGLTGYSQNDGTAVFMAFRMYDEANARAIAAESALAEMREERERVTETWAADIVRMSDALAKLAEARGLLAEDAAGQPVTCLIRDAAALLHAGGSGPVVDRLRAFSFAIEAFLASIPDAAQPAPAVEPTCSGIGCLCACHFKTVDLAAPAVEGPHFMCFCDDCTRPPAQTAAPSERPTPRPGRNHKDGCDGQAWRWSGYGYNRVRLCACGAEDHAPAPPPERAPADELRPNVCTHGTPTGTHCEECTGEPSPDPVAAPAKVSPWKCAPCANGLMPLGGTHVVKDFSFEGQCWITKEVPCSAPPVTDEPEEGR